MALHDLRSSLHTFDRHFAAVSLYTLDRRARRIRGIISTRPDTSRALPCSERGNDSCRSRFAARRARRQQSFASGTNSSSSDSLVVHQRCHEVDPTGYCGDTSQLPPWVRSSPSFSNLSSFFLPAEALMVSSGSGTAPSSALEIQRKCADREKHCYPFR